MMTVRAKFRKSREMPLHPATLAELAGYPAMRDLAFPAREGHQLVVCVVGAAVQATSARCSATGRAGPGSAADGPVRPVR